MNHVGWMSPEPPKIPAVGEVLTGLLPNGLLPTGLLTGGESQMLELLGAGLSSRLIAEKLGLSVRDVKSALMLLYRRLGVQLRDRTQPAE